MKVSNKDVNVSNYVVLNSGPSAHPARFRANYDQPRRPTSVQLSWEAVPEEQRNGVITGYVLVVTAVTGNDIISNTTALRPSLFLYQVTGLMIDTVYNVSLAARTSVGVGPAAYVLVSTVRLGNKMDPHILFKFCYIRCCIQFF